jgi:hypothetical protein
MEIERRRFTILEHHWNGIHWDFLVEDGPTLRTWAIDERPVEGRELAAKSLPAHRRIYLDYEGEISDGRGTVTRWDSGFCEVLEWVEDRVRLEVHGNQVEGMVEFGCLLVDEVRRWVFRWGKLS